MKNVEYKIISGAPGNVLPALVRSVGAFSRHYSDVKVGITGRNPQTRFSEHLRVKEWDKMVVKYKTSSQNFVNKIEDYFIANNRKLKNEWVGTSHLTESNTYFLYVLLGGKKQV
jgi:hypothetical protein